MAWNSKLIKRIVRTDSSDVMHSSGIAKAQNANSFGSGSRLSYAQRKSIDANRKYLSGYGRTSAAQGTDTQLAQRRAAESANTVQRKEEFAQTVNGNIDRLMKREGRYEGPKMPERESPFKPKHTDRNAIASHAPSALNSARANIRNSISSGIKPDFTK